MVERILQWWVRVLIAGVAETISVPVGSAEAANVGAKTCKECHNSAYAGWKKTKHFKGFAGLHRSGRAKAILKTVQGKSSAKKNWSCTLCHYTMVVKRGRKARAKSGVSCESCHGGGVRWLDVHWDPGPHKTHDQEPPEHKQQRLGKARELGMVYSGMSYELAKSCTLCHGLARNDLPAEKLARMFEAGHPIQAEFEHLAYSMGTVRHSFDGADPGEPSMAKRARLLVIGAAAKLVSATEAAGRIDHPAYVSAQRQRAERARRVLAALDDMPAAKTLLASPTDANARALAAAVESADVLPQVRSLLPSPSSYK